MSRRTRAIVVLYALLALLVVPVFPHFVSPNEFGRWALAASIAERGTFAVDAVAPLLGPLMEDLSTHGGRLFSNKAPGGALAALSGYFAVRPITGPPSRAAMRPSLDAMRLAGATLPAVLLVLLFAWAGPRFGGESSRVPLALGALLLGTPLFAYGLLLFSHALAALCLFAAWVALFLPAEPGRARRCEVAAGALLGIAAISEYPTAAAALVLVLFAARGGVPRLSRIALGALPFALMLLFYDARCFGGPFELSSAHEAFPSYGALASSGFFGLGWPSPSRLARLLIDPGKGLLVFSPFLLLAPQAYVSTSFVLPKDAFRSLLAVPTTLLLVTAAYPGWHGGWTVGARYLVTALPFLVFPFVFRGGGKLEASLVGASVLSVALTTLTFPFAPRELLLPWASLGLPLLSHGLVVPNLLHLVARPLALAVPFALVLAAAALAAGRRAGLAALGAAAWLSASLLFPAIRRPALHVLEARGYVEEVYFERDGALERTLGVPVPPRLRAREEVERKLPPGPWPF